MSLPLSEGKKEVNDFIWPILEDTIIHLAGSDRVTVLTECSHRTATVILVTLERRDDPSAHHRPATLQESAAELKL